jgi:hypothetical protein
MVAIMMTKQNQASSQARQFLSAHDSTKEKEYMMTFSLKNMGFTLFAVIISASGWAQQSHEKMASGILLRQPVSDYFDYDYLHEMHAAPGSLANGPIQLQARFIWEPPSPAMIGQPLAVAQHAGILFSQALDSRTMLNVHGERYWTHGAGAIVTESGLALELWHAKTEETPLKLNADVWGPYSNCIQDVQGTIEPGKYLCLSTDPTAHSFLTSAPGFKLRYGYSYWLRITISPIEPGWAMLYAELIEQNPWGMHMVQTGRAGFEINRFWPLQQAPWKASIGRTPGSPAEERVHYVAFNHF